MPTSPTQIRIDSKIKNQANKLFNDLGLDLSSAVNIFLRQCIMRGGLPFLVEMPNYNEETFNAMTEAKKISKDSKVPYYNTIEELNASLVSE